MCHSAADPAHACPTGKQKMKKKSSQSRFISNKDVCTGVERLDWQEKEQS